jgi:oligopeptide transport system ATP-binding protein
MNKLLEVEDLHVTFHARGEQIHAVRGIDFAIYEGEILGIVGESGCGKSAAAKALLKLIPPHQATIGGHIYYEGKDLAAYSEKEMRQIRGKEISMIFQDPMTSLNPTLKIGVQIVEGYLRHYPNAPNSTAWNEAIEMLKRVGIPNPEERMHTYPHTLSGGMRQRVMIALALCCKPKLLLADEPTTALDVTIQAQILDLMKQINNETRTSMILITHDLSVVAHFCDRVLVMYAGKIVESASVEQLFAHPRHPYTKRLLKAIPRLDQPKSSPLLPIEGMPPNLSLPLPGCSFCARCSDAMNICTRQSPPLYPVGVEHFSACFTHDERASQ